MYTSEQNAQILLSLLKSYGIKRAVVSPGSMNIPITSCLTDDPWFEAYSAYDERSAAYMACGLASETGEPVFITCTGATASRDYMPGLTEAFYRKLPVLAVTCMHDWRGIGNFAPQTIDRFNVPNDVAVYSAYVDIVKDDEDEKHARLEICKAIDALSRDGGGPSHIQLISTYSKKYSVEKLPAVTPIRVHRNADGWPDLDPNKKIAIVIGSHAPFILEEKEVLDRFLKSYNAVALVDKTSGYYGNCALDSLLVCSQFGHGYVDDTSLAPDLVIHLGEVSGDTPTYSFLKKRCKRSWRVSEDGRIAERFPELTHVFKASPAEFFARYAERSSETWQRSEFANAWFNYDNLLRQKMPELPYSNCWIAQRLSGKLQDGAVAHLGIYNSLRSWSYFDTNPKVRFACNVGGFGIDGAVSTLLGSSLAEPETPHYLFLGDLAFFYDMNALGNRHLGNNVRILMVNNGLGVEFSLSTHVGHQFGEEVGRYIAAEGHNLPKNNQGITPAQAWATSLGLRYVCARNKDEFAVAEKEFLECPANSSILFECIVDSEKEDWAQQLIRSIDPKKSSLKDAVKQHVPSGAKTILKGFMK